MNPENAPMLGYVILIVGIALSIIGYVIYLNLRGEKARESTEDSEDEAMIMVEGSNDINSDDVLEEDLVGDPVEESAEEITDQDAEPDPTIIVPDKPELIPAATLFREGVTGQIVVKVGERQYSDIESLKSSKDWSRVKSISSDLANWIEERPSPTTPQREREDKDLSHSLASQGSDSDSMIVQINEIITRKVEAMEGEEREIMLVEGAVGVLEVRVGVEKFPIDEVPYTNVRDLIQDAVSEWEKSQ